MPKENVMVRACRTTLLAALVLALLGAAPLAVQAHDGQTFGSPAYGRLAKSTRGAKLVLKAWHLHQQLDDLKARAPRAVGRECRGTIVVPGQGPSCVTASGDWLTSVPGRDVESHGPDPLAVGAATIVVAGLTPASQAAVDGAGPANVVCAANARQPQFRAVYARPAGVAFDPQKLTAFRTAIYQASAYLQQQATADGSTTLRRLRVACSGGVMSIDTVQLPTVGPATSFASITTDMTGLGYLSAGPANIDTMVYIDQQVDDLGGQGTRPTDSRPGVINSANAGQYLSVTYNDPYAVANPNWATLLHEAMHNMGAVQDDAPDATGAGHCNRDLDIMCYADGGPNGQTTYSVCATTELDCGGDAYFNAGPITPTNYLYSHWNTGSPNNLFLDHGALTIDGSPPSAPGTPTRSSATSTSLTASWTASADDTAVTGYRIDRYVSGAWSQLATQTGTTYTVTGLAPSTPVTLRVLARDAAGNWSAASTSAVLSSAPDTTAPTAPVVPTLQSATEGSVTVQWDPTSDDIGVTTYAVWVETSAGVWTQVATKPAATRSYTRTGVAPSTIVRLQVDARDAAGNISARSPIASVSTLADTTAPGIGWLSDQAVGQTTADVSWTGSSDPSGIDAYVLQISSDGTWTTVLESTALAAHLDGLTAGTNYELRFAARDGAGNQSVWSGTLSIQTLPPDAPDPPAGGGGGGIVIGTNPTPGGTAPILNVLQPITQQPITHGTVTPVVATPIDTTAPSAVAKARSAGATRTSVKLTWNAASDNQAVKLYRIYVRVGKTYVKRGQIAAKAKAGSYVLRKLRAKTSYVVAIEAVDAAGNAGKRVLVKVRTK